jgi:hypothetical protein
MKMKHVLVVVGTSFCLTGFANASFSQDPEVLPGSLVTSYVRKAPVGLDFSQPPQIDVTPNMVFDATTGALLGPDGAGPNDANFDGAAAGHDNGSFDDGRHTPTEGTIDGLDSVATFDGAFAAQAGPSKGKVFRFTMMGNHPLAGGTTLIPAKIAEVSLRLLNADGSVFQIVSFQPFEDLTLDSPNFEESDYSSGRRIQYADAVPSCAVLQPQERELAHHVAAAGRQPRDHHRAALRQYSARERGHRPGALIFHRTSK